MNFFWCRYRDTFILRKQAITLYVFDIILGFWSFSFLLIISLNYFPLFLLSEIGSHLPSLYLCIQSDWSIGLRLSSLLNMSFILPPWLSCSFMFTCFHVLNVSSSFWAITVVIWCSQLSLRVPVVKRPPEKTAQTRVQVNRMSLSGDWRLHLVLET